MTPEWYEPPLPQHPGISNWVHDMRMGYIQPHNDLLPIYDNPNPFAGHDFTEHIFDQQRMLNAINTQVCGWCHKPNPNNKKLWCCTDCAKERRKLAIRVFAEPNKGGVLAWVD